MSGVGSVIASGIPSSLAAATSPVLLGAAINGNGLVILRYRRSEMLLGGGEDIAGEVLCCRVNALRCTCLGFASLDFASLGFASLGACISALCHAPTATATATAATPAACTIRSRCAFTGIPRVGHYFAWW